MYAINLNHFEVKDKKRENKNPAFKSNEKCNTKNEKRNMIT